MYESAWYDSGQLVPDQVTPASDATPLEDSGAGSAGFSTSYRLRISTDGNTLTFNGNGLVDIATDQTITAIGFDDDLRISRTDPTDTGNTTIQLVCSRTSNTSAIIGQCSIFSPQISAEINPQSFVIAVSSQAGDNTRELQISADGNTLTF
ncbi:MAG: hypothetical protein EZS28_044239, partial [Streblomastix strix]